jgi:hypothetical protein
MATGFFAPLNQQERQLLLGSCLNPKVNLGPAGKASSLGLPAATFVAVAPLL